MKTFVSRWWPVPAFFIGVGAMQAVTTARIEAHGHAAGHLGSASALFPMVGLYATLIWALPRARRKPELWALGAILGAGLAAVMAGNLRVVDAIGGETWTDAHADALGAGRSGFASGHDLAGTGSLVCVAAVLLIAVALLLRGTASRRVGIGAIVASVLFPPWIVPGAGLVVLAVAACLARRRLFADSPRVTGAVCPQAR